jgi:hypothetical protein
VQPFDLFNLSFHILFGLGEKKSSPFAIMISLGISNCQFWPWSFSFHLLFGLGEKSSSPHHFT